MGDSNDNTPRRSNRKKKEFRKKIPASADVKDSSSTSSTKLTKKPQKVNRAERQKKGNSNLTPSENCFKKDNNLPTLADLENMFNNSNSDDGLIGAPSNKRYKPSPSIETGEVMTPLSNKVVHKCDQTETESNNNNAAGPTTSSNQEIQEKIDLTAHDEESYLKELENEISDDSSCSSTSTITYDYNTVQNRPNTFSPLPSTSKDNETMMQNEILFNESIHNNSHYNNSERIANNEHSGNITPNSDQQNTVEISHAAITDDEYVESSRNLHIDNSVVIDLESYRYKRAMTGNVSSSRNTKRSIIINKKSAKSNSLNAYIYVHSERSRGPTSSIAINSTGRNNYHSQNATSMNRSNTVTISTTDSENNSDNGPRNESAIASLSGPNHKLRHQTGGETTVQPNIIPCRKINLKVMSWNRLNVLKSLAKDIHKLKKQTFEAMRRNEEALYNSHSSSEEQENSPRNDSDANQERDNMSNRDSNDPINLGVCPICMEPFDKDIASTLCGHLFCMRCIKAALTITGKKCPTCRKTLRGVGYHQIYI